MTFTLLPKGKTLHFSKKHISKKHSHHSPASSKSGQGLNIHHLAHQMKHMRVGGAILRPQSDYLVTGSGTHRHHKPLSIEDFKKRPISKIF